MQFLHRNIVPAVLLLALFCVPMPAFAALDPLTVTVDEASTELQAYTDGDILFMGASDIATLFNVEYTQDTEANTVTYTLGKTLFGKKEAVFTVDTATVSINGKDVPLETAPVISNDTMLIPLKDALAIWGASCGANEEALYIHTDGSEVIVPVIEKVFVEKQAVSVGDKTAMIRYIRIPADSQLKADIVFAQNSIGNTEELSSMATRTSAKAAINGGFFQSFDNAKAKEPYGLLIKNGKLIHSDNTGSTLGFTKDGSIKMDVLRSSVVATIADTTYTVSLMNHSPAIDSNTVALFTSAYDETLHTTGAAVIVQNGAISAISKEKVITIPKDGYVLVFTGSKAADTDAMQKGDTVSYEVSYVNANNAKVNWSDVQTAIGAGPILLKDGKAALNPVKEGFTDTTSFQMPVARSAVGITEDGTILLVGNVKCIAEEMSAVMLELGAEQAIAMDSGSSSGLYSIAEDAVAAPAKAISNALIFK